MTTGFAVQWKTGGRTMVPGTHRRIVNGHTVITGPGQVLVILLRGSYKMCWPVSDRDQHMEEAELCGR